MLEELPLEVQLDTVTLVESLEKFSQHLLLSVTDESFTAEVTILGKCDLKLFGQTLYCHHIYVAVRVVGCDWRHLMQSGLVKSRHIQRMVVRAAKEFTLRAAGALSLLLWLRDLLRH